MRSFTTQLIFNEQSRTISLPLAVGFWLLKLSLLTNMKKSETPIDWLMKGGLIWLDMSKAKCAKILSIIILLLMFYGVSYPGTMIF